MKLSPLQRILAACLIVLGIAISWSIAARTAGDGVAEAWNRAIATIPEEDQNFRDLSDSLHRNPPGRVLLTPDVRAEQKRRRLKLVDAIIATHEQRIRDLRDLRKSEEASQ